VKRGKTENDKQRYLCQNQDCPGKTFILDYTYKGYLLEIKQQIIDMALNGSGIRDTARVLGISPNTIINEISPNTVINEVNTPPAGSRWLRIPTGSGQFRLKPA
jgi:transposase-like protein